MGETRQTALVTGASGGIGRSLAYKLASEGYDLLLTARSLPDLVAVCEDCKRRHGIDCIVIPVDLAQTGAADNLVGQIAELGIEVDVLINNAGFGDYGRFVANDGAKEADMISLNVVALTRLLRLLVPDMVRRGRGRVMNVASTAAFVPGPYMAVYYATKAYVLSLSEALANELEGTGVSVTALCPGPTRTGFNAVASAGTNPLFKSRGLPSPDAVADYGYRAMMEGRPVAVHGFMNRVMTSVVGFFPRSWVTRIIRSMQERR